MDNAKIIQESFTAPKLVTVLIPTRGRFPLLRNAIEALRDTATRPDDIDIQLAVDDDDTDTLSQLHNLKDITVTIGENVGYSGTADRHNKMFRKSVGEFLLLYADDAIVDTRGWDDIIREYRGQVCIPFVRDENTCFIHRSIPTVWEKLTVYYCAEIIYKLIALELGIYIRHDEIHIFNVPADAQGRDRGGSMPPNGWFDYKDEIYALTDSLKPYIPAKYAANKPLSKHPINDTARNKYYFGPGAIGWIMPPPIG